MDELKELWIFLQKFEEKWGKLQKSRPFYLNLLDYCRTYENAHTQILLEILRYNEGVEYPLIESFLRKLDINIQWKYAKTKIEFNKDFIDGYLCDEVHAVIIENKINGAYDQHKQIERYVDIVRNRNIAIENIYVAYLTRDGSKRVSSSSCSSELKEKIGQYIECNYRDHILPWLKEDVLPQCKLKDDVFVSAIKQYIDYLNGIFKQRVGDEKMNEEVIEFLKKNMKINGSGESYDQIVKKIDILDNMKNFLESIRREVKESVVSTTCEYWKNKYGDNEGFVQDGLYNYLLYGKSKWNVKNLMIHLEWIDITSDEVFYKNKNLSMALHFEGNNAHKYVNYLEKYKADYLVEMDKVGMTIDENHTDALKRLNCRKVVSFNQPLAAMTDVERKNALFKAYDEAKPLLDYVYRKCEECDSNN